MDTVHKSTAAPRPLLTSSSSSNRAQTSAARNYSETSNGPMSEVVVPMEALTNPYSSISSPFTEGESEDDICFADEEISVPFSSSLGLSQVRNVDQLVAQEMSKLSLAERNNALCDLHAVTSADAFQQPSPDVQRRLLQEVQTIIRNDIPNDRKAAYERAVTMDASYAQGDKFVLKFLRTDGWDPKLAAVRLVKHFQVKLELFHSDLLCRDIIQDDLDAQALEFLYSERVRDLPLRDMAGRIVTLVIPGPGYDVMSKVRRAFYTNMVKAEDEETQMKGRVMIVWLADTAHGMDAATAWKVGQMCHGMPTKQSAIHICVPDKQMSLTFASAFTLFGYAIERLAIVRTKCHFGTPVELKSKLQDYGIPSSIIPISDSGEVQTNQLNLKWAERRLEERLLRDRPPNRHPENRTPHQHMCDIRVGMGNSEKVSQSERKFSLPSIEARKREPSRDPDSQLLQFVHNPSNSDVLLGRGRLCQRHVGNIRFLQFIKEQRHIFDALPTKGDKSRMAEKIVTHIKTEFRGRFLQEQGSGWMEVSDGVARTKVATCFRTLKCLEKKDRDSNSQFVPS